MGKSVAHLIRFAAPVLWESRFHNYIICFSVLCVMGKSIVYLIWFVACVLWESQLLI